MINSFTFLSFRGPFLVGGPTCCALPDQSAQ
jgi:hypothetical protein